MDFRICRPLESEGKNFTPCPLFWVCTDKMMTYLLHLLGRPEGHGIRPRSLKAATISAPTIEEAQCRSDLSQLAIRGNYRSVDAKAMAKVYSTNLANRQLPASIFARGISQNNTSLESAIDPPVFPGDTQQRGVGDFEVEFHCLKPHDWAL